MVDSIARCEDQADLTLKRICLFQDFYMIYRAGLLDSFDAIAIPETADQVQQLFKGAVFKQIKRVFPHSRIRVNSQAFSVRIEEENFIQIYKFLEALEKDDWMDWISEHLQPIHRQIRRAKDRMRNYDMKERDDYVFLYIPFTIRSFPNIYNQFSLYNNLRSLTTTLKEWMDLYPQIDVIKSETQSELERRRRAHQEVIDRERERYGRMLEQQLFVPLSGIKHNAVANQFRAKLTEKGMDKIALPFTYKNALPVGTKVTPVILKGSDHDGWYVVPYFAEVKDAPEGYEIPNLWGEVTGFDDSEERRSHPVNVNQLLQFEFHEKDWIQYAPEGYQELREATQAIIDELGVPVDWDQLIDSERAAQSEAGNPSTWTPSPEETAHDERQSTVQSIADSFREQLSRHTEAQSEATEENPYPMIHDVGFYQDRENERWILRTSDGVNHLFTTQDAMADAAMGILPSGLNIVRNAHDPSTPISMVSVN